MKFATQGFACYIIHFTPLENRRRYLEKTLKNLEKVWVVEKDIQLQEFKWIKSKKVFGVRSHLIAADLGINTRSLSRSRRKARFESYFFRFAHLIGPRFSHITYGSLPKIRPLPSAILEVNLMHIKSLRKFLESECAWGLFLEDDCVLGEGALPQVKSIVSQNFSKPIWVNLGGGAGLDRTKSDRRLDANGLFRVKPPTTRCASAYLINREYALRFESLMEKYGLPEWLPIDIIYQIANRKMKARSYWSYPIRFFQGSSSGEYESNLNVLRTEK
jgi:hypothetical protein